MCQPSSGDDLTRFRREVQIVFQDPYASLSPRMTVQDILSEPLAIHGVGERSERRDRCAAMLKRVGLDPSHLGRFPHAFSGGQRQRISIARALMLEPEAADLRRADLGARRFGAGAGARPADDLREEFNLSYLFISHDLAVVRASLTRSR